MNALPQGWRWAYLGDICERPDYGLTASATAENTGIRFLRITDIQDGGVNWDSVPFCQASEREVKDNALAPGDLVIARIGATTGKAYLITSCPAITVFASYLIRLRATEEAEPSFLHCFFNTGDYWHQIDQNKGGRLKGGVNIPILQSLRLPLPSLPEQRAIAAALRAVQEARDARRRELAVERERKAALMEDLFTNGTNGEPLKETEIGAIPQSWAVVNFGELFATQLGKMLSPKAKTGAEPLPYIRNANVQWGRIYTHDLYTMDFSEAERKKFRLLPGDILMCEGGEIGRCAIWEGQIEECYYQKAVHRIRPKSENAIATFYVHFLEWAFKHRDLYGVTGTQTTIAHLPKEKLLVLKVPQPGAPEQIAITESLTACDAKIEALIAEAALLDELFRAMLDELLSGRLSSVPLIEPDAVEVA